MNLIHTSICRGVSACTIAACIMALVPTSKGGASPALESANPIGDWWHGKYASGDWLSMRTTLEDHGVTPFGSWKSTFYGITDGGLDSPRGAFDEEITLGLKLDFEKLAGIKGLSAQGSARWRDGRNPDTYVGASPTFNPTSYQVGLGWRLMPFFLTWESRDLLPVKDMITVSGGWTNPYYSFIQQPDSKLFLNNAITQTKGLTGNGLPWSGTYAGWGGHIKVKPAEWAYTQAGLYMAIPDALSNSNHGLDLQGAYPPERNGLYFISETGVTPKIGGLPGKYAMGGYYWGIENKSFYGQAYDGKYGLYWQADQMLYREPSHAAAPAPQDKEPTEAKSFKEPVNIAPSTPNEQGLYAFGFINYAPKYDNALPLYFHAGLVYKGLFPGRDKDQLGVAFALGNYSYYKIVAEEDAGKTIHQTNEAVVEVDYRAQLNKFLYVQPFWQYIIRPGGTGMVENANILGLHMGVTF